MGSEQSCEKLKISLQFLAQLSGYRRLYLELAPDIGGGLHGRPEFGGAFPHGGHGVARVGMPGGFGAAGDGDKGAGRQDGREG